MNKVRIGKWVAGITFSGIMLGGGTVAGVGIIGSLSINSTRSRWFADDFVLTPESLRMPYIQAEFRTVDNIPLRGWWIPQTVRGQPSDRVVMCFAPFSHDKSTLLAISRGLWDSGHSVFLFDFRSHGPTQTRHTIGYLEERDATAALSWLRENAPKSAKISLMGCSMGGALALTLAGKEISNGKEITCVATDCAFSNLRKVLKYYIEWQHLRESKPFIGGGFKGKESDQQQLQKAQPSQQIASIANPTLISTDAPLKIPFAWFPTSLQNAILDLVVDSICFFNELIYGYNPADVGPLQYLQHINVPLLILQNTNDSIVPPSSALDIYKGTSTAMSKKELILAPGEHISSYYQNEHLYIRRLVQFLDQCYDQPSRSPFASIRPIEEDLSKEFMTPLPPQPVPPQLQQFDIIQQLKPSIDTTSNATTH